MTKSILNLEGVKTLTTKEKAKVNGAGGIQEGYCGTRGWPPCKEK